MIYTHSDKNTTIPIMGNETAKMLIKQLIEVFGLLDSSTASGADIADYLRGIDPKADVEVSPLVGPRGKTDMVKIRIPGTNGKAAGGSAPTIGILGRLGAIGARAEMIGYVSDGDGAQVALDMRMKGDFLPGDVFISTHICPDAPTQPHKPVPFMGSPVEMAQVNRAEVTPDLDAVLSVDTTKGNRVINTRGFAISPTVKEGYILKTSEDLLEVMQRTTGRLPYVFPLTVQDITPYGNELYHLNSILQPSTATNAPVVVGAITTETAVPGCGTGASHYTDVEEAARFMLEVAKAYGWGEVSFYDEEEYARIQKLYGTMNHIQTLGRED